MILKFVLCLLLFSCSYVARGDGHQCDETVRHLGEDDWQVILKGKWVIKFYANWCPACQSFKADFEDLAKNFHAEGFCAAAADVSLNAGLSGRFFVTSLPTFYLIQDGEIRMYRGVRSKEALSQFVLGEGWMDTPLVPWYISPTSCHMAALGTFFRLSMALRNFHTHITEKWGVPVWVSYIAFALFTIFVGLLFGLFIVFLCDLSLGPVTPDEQKKRADPFGMETPLVDTEEDVVDDDNRGVEGRSEDEEDEEEDDEGEEETAGVEDLEADDEGEEPKKDTGSGEPRRRKKASHGDDYDDDEDDDDDDDRHDNIEELEEEKKK